MTNPSKDWTETERLETIRFFQKSSSKQLFSLSHIFLLKNCSFSARQPAKDSSKSISSKTFERGLISKILEEECPRQGPGLNCDLAELPASKIRKIGERIYFLANKAASLLESQREFVLGTGEKKE